MITVKNLHKSFHGTDVLKGINETIHKGEKVVVIGPSGSGKSTFLRCLNLLETPTEGEVWVEGNNITAPKTDIDKVRQKMGMVFQHFNLFPHLTVKKNITLAPTTLKLQTEEEAGENAMRLLKRIGLEEKADSYPNQLSGGQKQRIAIIRALAMNPDVMLFDEPTPRIPGFKIFWRKRYSKKKENPQVEKRPGDFCMTTYSFPVKEKSKPFLLSAF